jgi:outer membrane immunogenic protein
MRSIALLTGLLLGAATTAAMGQAVTSPTTGGDVALTYHWVRTNTQPADCGCFDLNGGGVSASWRFSEKWAAVAEVSGEHADGGPGTGNSLTLVSYLAGARYMLLQGRKHGSHSPEIFAQVLVGAAHAGGGIAGAGDGTVTFAARVGGGIDVPLGSRFAIRAIQIDYDVTNFANSVNDHQNNLLLGAGLVYRWGR